MPRNNIQSVAKKIIESVTSCRFMIINILVFPFLITPSLAQEFNRILVLQTTFEESDWKRQFNATFTEVITAGDITNVRVAFQSLGVDRPMTPASRSRLLRHIENLIEEHGIDLIVTVFPKAWEFASELEGTTGLPHVLVMPGLESSLNMDGGRSSSMVIVPSSWRQAIYVTLEQILILRPQTQTIEVFVGSDPFGQIFVDRLQQITPRFVDRVEFDYHIGLSREALTNYASQLGDSSSVLLLPDAAFGQGQYNLSVLPDVTAASAVPIFGFIDALIGKGIVGGNVSAVDGYASAAAEMAIDLLRGVADPGPVAAPETTTIFDWRQVERWGLQLQLLDTPYTLLFKPNSLWEEYPIISFAALNLILILIAGLLIQFMLLKRSKAAQLIIAASEKKARASEAQYRLLADNSLDVIWTWDTESASLNYCSPAIEALTGFTPEEYVGRKLNELMVPASVALYQSLLDNDDINPHVVEAELYKKERGTVWCEIAAQQTAPQPGMPIEWVGVTRDISQRRENAAERRALENQVRQSQKIESLGTLAGGIAHDFNNLLAVVIGITELLKVKLKDHQSASQLVTRLTSALDKAKALVSQILTFGRQSQGQKEVTNLSAVLEDSLEILKAGIPKQVTLKKQIDAEALNVMADPSHVGQVIINLVNNASEAIDHPGGCIGITLSQCSIDQAKGLPYGRLVPGGYASLQVSDNGAGMSEKQIDKIFEPFFTSKELGSGLGLSIVHGIVMEHEGGIDIHSVPGEGTTITVYLPLTEAKMPVLAVAKAEAAEIDLESKRILVVDDNLDLLDMVSSMLGHLGHSCILCSDPREAFELLEHEHHNLDLVITDYSMPHISGIEILQHCSKHYPTLPVILSTGYADEVVNQFDDGRSDIRLLNKPYKFGDLKDVLHQTF